MGNAESCKGLAKELDRLESTLAVLAATNPVGVRPLLPHQVHVHGIVLNCSRDVRVNVGPVVGVVGPNKARILLEVNAATTITCHVSRLERMTGQFLEVATALVAVQAPRDVPVVFSLTQLEPNTTYYYAFSGLTKVDATTCQGHFHTLAVDDDAPLQIAVVSGHDAYEQTQNDLWAQLARRVAQDTVATAPSTAAPLQFVLHLGGQVVLARAFEQAWVLLSRHAQSLATTVPSTASWSEMEAVVVAHFREAYRFQWRLPCVREVLAGTSNLMLWGDHDVYANFATATAFRMDHANPTIEMQVMRVLLRSARLVYHEYQRQLWDEDFPAFQANDGRRRALAEGGFTAATAIFQRRLELTELEATMAVAKRKMDFASTKLFEARQATLKADIAALQQQVLTAQEDLVPERGEEFMLWTERHIAFLFVDVRGSHLSPGGVPTPENPLLSPAQWDYIEAALRDPRTRLLVVCSELPIADDATERIAAFAAADPAAACASWWGQRPDDRHRLLALIADWKVELPNRDAVLFAGASGTKWPLTSTVSDLQMRGTFAQYVVGPITMPPSTRTLPARHAALSDRFEVAHTVERPLEANFAVVELTAAEARDPTVAVTHVRQMAAAARVLLGPVVGLVDATSAVLLLEVDRAATVACVLTSVYTPATSRLVQVLSARRPHRFHFTNLSPELHYTVHVEGLAEPLRDAGHFRTPAAHPGQFCVALLGLDRLPPFATTTAAPTLWSALEATLAEPFAAVDLVLHLGGQVSPGDHASVDAARATIRAADTALNAASDASTMEELVRDQLRNMYRHHWNLATTKTTLAMGSHLMVPSEVDRLEVPAALAREDSPAETGALSELLTALAAEYQLQLWPASSVKVYPYCHTWGAFGVFVWPKMRVDERWSALAAFLAHPPLTTVVIVCDQPLIDDSVEDLQAKAQAQPHPYATTFPHHGADLLRLVETLFAWHHRGAKQIVFVCGHEHFGFDTFVQDAVTKSRSLRQFVVGPLSPGTAIDQGMAYLDQGSLGTDCTFAHNFDANYLAPHLGYLLLSPTTIDGYEIVTLDGDKTSMGSVARRVPAAEWCQPPRTPEWLAAARAKAMTPAAQDKVDALVRLLATKSTEIADSYDACYAPMQCRKSRLTAAQALYPGLQRFYEIAGLEVRALAGLPSIFVVAEVCLHDAKLEAIGFAVDRDRYISILTISFTKSILVK
ncbi:hypothetical protein ACHHYP_02561 [Achlya hypogyna]|uniref:PhoD-like phosphatase metallophosphatase domain-containing protein n=1 Tax=Achlya hypogyna TaxID=1202772 RepID=A0A1V9Z681_ACHHY|nr:hypothetical protein ACHHYP_02561 [Achlya hypogyna]